VKDGGGRVRAWRHSGEPALGIRDGRGSPKGLTHGGGESAERNRLGCQGPATKGPSGSAGERRGVSGGTEGGGVDGVAPREAAGKLGSLTA
jgi:hypothetical protein